MKRYNPIEFRYGELVLADTVECEIGDYYRVSDVDDEINTLKSEIELKDKEIAVLKDKLAAIVSGDIGVLPEERTFYMREFLTTPLILDLDIPLGAEVKVTYEWEE